MLIFKLYEIVEPLYGTDDRSAAMPREYNFNEELARIEVSPKQLNQHHISNLDLIGRLSKFSLPEEANMTIKVSAARHKAKEYFQGMCLDCIYESPATSTKHISDNCPHGLGHNVCMRSCNVEWNRGCRIKHGEPTWYFSSNASKFLHERLFQC